MIQLFWGQIPLVFVIVWPSDHFFDTMVFIFIQKSESVFPLESRCENHGIVILQRHGLIDWLMVGCFTQKNWVIATVCLHHSTFFWHLIPFTRTCYHGFFFQLQPQQKTSNNNHKVVYAGPQFPQKEEAVIIFANLTTTTTTYKWQPDKENVLVIGEKDARTLITHTKWNSPRSGLPGHVGKLILFVCLFVRPTKEDGVCLVTPGLAEIGCTDRTGQLCCFMVPVIKNGGGGIRTRTRTSQVTTNVTTIEPHGIWKSGLHTGYCTSVLHFNSSRRKKQKRNETAITDTF